MLFQIIQFLLMISSVHSCAAETVFWLHGREQPSPNGVDNIKKSAVSRGKNISKITGQKSSKYGEIIKKLISVFGESPLEVYPSHPPPYRIDNLHVERTLFQDANVESRRGIETWRKGKGEKIMQNLKTQQRNDILTPFFT